jgi:hypothetical protein
MRSPRNLFIVGAGASNEAGLPTGVGLIGHIRQKLGFVVKDRQLVPDTGDLDILDIFQQREEMWEGIEKYLKASARIKDGSIYSKSIDSFLDLHQDDAHIQAAGKLAIGRAILEAEKNSHLFIERGSTEFKGADQLKDSWYFELTKNLADGVRKVEVERLFENIGFIVFNYDRCLEHFMFNALQQLYGIDEQRAANVMKTMTVVHPYGTIGDLDWQNRKSGMPFGFQGSRAAMELMISRIRTYTEQVADEKIPTTVKQLVTEADTIVFLGFSYHAENMRLLTVPDPGAAQRVFGTTKGISKADTEVVRDQIRNMIAGKSLKPAERANTSESMFLSNCTCSKLLQDYSRNLFISGTGRAGQ